MSQKLKDIADDLRQIATEIEAELTVKPLDVKRGNVTLAEADRLVRTTLGDRKSYNIGLSVWNHCGPELVIEWAIYTAHDSVHYKGASLDKALSKFMEAYGPKPEPTDLDAVTEIIDGVKPEKIEEPAF